MATADPSEAALPPRLLVVDNELVIRRLLTMYLQHSGFTCDAASSGEEALGIVAQEPDRFRVVITDLDMPEMNGLQLATLLREKYPALREVLKQLAGVLTVDEMRKLNFAVDGEKRQAKDVAQEFLRGKAVLR